MADARTITVTVNGKMYRREVETRLTLADFLRRELELTGTHVGCEHGVYGACTVLIGGASARACLMLAVQCDGESILTVEGLAAGSQLNPLQQAFQDNHGLQCGFCTPGILMTLTEFLRNHSDPTETEVREVLSDNLCRCTGYQSIVAAAAAFPEKPIRIIVPTAIGGPSDLCIRTVTEAMYANLGQPLSVENITGATGNIGLERVATAAADALLTKLAGQPRLVLETIKRYRAKAAHLTPDMASEYAGTLMALVRA